MFDIAPSELLLVAIVALVVIGPKDLPRAMRFVGQWVGKARGMARHFRSGFDEMVRQAEMEEMEKRWAAENARIMAEHPAVPAEEADDAYHAAAPALPPVDPAVGTPSPQSEAADHAEPDALGHASPIPLATTPGAAAELAGTIATEPPAHPAEDGR